MKINNVLTVIFLFFALSVFFVAFNKPVLAISCGACTCCEDWKTGTCSANCDRERVIHGYSTTCPGGGPCDFCGCDEAGGGGGGVPNKSVCKGNKCVDVYDPLGRDGNCTYDADCATPTPQPAVSCSISLSKTQLPNTRVNWRLNISNGPAVVDSAPKTSGNCNESVATCTGLISTCVGYFKTGTQENKTCTITATVRRADNSIATCRGTVTTTSLSPSVTLTPSVTVPVTTGTVTVSPTAFVSQTPTTTPSLTPRPSTPPSSSHWFKTELGNVHSNSDIIDPIPKDDFFASYLVSVNSLSTFGPLGTNDAAPERASKSSWFWYSPPYGKVVLPELPGFYNYYLNHRIPNETEVIIDLNNSFFSSKISSNKIKVINITPPGRILTTQEDINLTGNQNIILYVDGDLVLKNNIITSENSGIIFVISGNLKINSNVIEADGVYFVDGSISTKDTDTNTPLVIKGALYTSANGKIFSNSRTLDTQTIPSEWITFEPKYLINYASVFGRNSMIWKEVNP